jgi:hypothetical protein
VDVVFEVASQPYPLDERAATLMAENLRVKAAHEPGAEGTVGARAVADAIELRLIEDTADPIALGGDGAEAVFFALNAPSGGGDRPWALFDAVKRLGRRAKDNLPVESRTSASATRSVSDSSTGSSSPGANRDRRRGRFHER